MKMSEKILHRMYPERLSFDDSEVSFVERVLFAYNSELILCRKNTSLPDREIPLGGIVSVSNRSFKCVLADAVSSPSDACSGCDFSRLYLDCKNLKCSHFDRSDGRFVWFKIIGNEISAKK